MSPNKIDTDADGVTELQIHYSSQRAESLKATIKVKLSGFSFLCIAVTGSSWLIGGAWRCLL